MAMRDALLRRVRSLRSTARRVERQRLLQIRRWLEDTSNLIHASILLFVPLLVGFVTLLANVTPSVSFLLFPPIASGTYTLFADPEGEYSSPRRFVGGMTLGAFCGWFALDTTSQYLYTAPPSEVGVHAGAAALGILFTGMVTWAMDLELPTAFSTSLLVLITGTDQLLYVVGVAVSTSIVALVFVVWRESFYERRARYLYRTIERDDHVLVPMLGDHAAETAMFGARIAAAHEAGKVVLLDVVTNETVAEAERALIDKGETEIEPGETSYVEGAESAAEEQAVDKAARLLEQQAANLQTEVGVPAEVVVAVGEPDDHTVMLEVAEDANCDLIVVPYEEDRGRLADHVRGLFGSSLDVVAFRSTGERTRWRRIMVPVRQAGDVAHAMIDYAQRLAGRTGTISVCHCIDDEADRRRAESMLAKLAETATGRVETRVSRSSIQSFLQRNDAHYDVIFVGASTNRTTASRFVAPPTFERLRVVETDIAIVHIPA